MGGPTLRVVQLNIGSLLEAGWPERRWELVAWLRRLEPDIACLEEVWEDAAHENTAAWVVDQLPELSLHHAFGGAPFAHDLWPDRSLQFGSAVLSRWPIERSVHHLLPIAPDDDPFVTGVPWELLHVRTAGLDVFACHLAPAPSHGLHRRLQVVAIDEIIRDVRGDLDDSPPPGSKRGAMPVILCGDFNAEPESDEIRFLSSYTPIDDRTTFYQDPGARPATARATPRTGGPTRRQRSSTSPASASTTSSSATPTNGPVTPGASYRPRSPSTRP